MRTHALLLYTFSALAHALAIRDFLSNICGNDLLLNQFSISQSDVENFTAEYVWMQRGEDAGYLKPRSKSIEVDTYFHLVLPNESYTDSQSIVYDQLEQQLYVLNQAYALHGIQFNLQSMNTTFNEDWSMDRNHHQMAQTLRQGNYSTLNIYFVQSFGHGSSNLGYCLIPNLFVNSSDFVEDGCTVLVSTLPGGSLTGYNSGSVTVHEVGHWFGLLHTFQLMSNSDTTCSGLGDTISDTLPQRFPTGGCPVSVDACPGHSLGPVYNYMDYNLDPCQKEFTLGQQIRMHNVFEKHRMGI